MVQDNKTSKDASVASDLDEVTRQLSALREDMTQLAETVSAIAGRRSSDLANDISEGFEEARKYAERTGKSAEDQLGQTVAAHPFLAIGLAAGAGLVIGALSRR